MKRIFESLSRGIFVLLFLGGIIVYLSGGMVITSLRPEYSFADLLEKDAEEGMHIKGEVQYVFDCFAYEETWKENRNGTRTPAKTSHYYYAIPGNGDNYIGLEVLVDGKDDMEALADETYDYLLGGEAPTTKIMVEGRLSRMDDEMSALFKEYLQEIGYTDSEIANMGDFYYVEQPASMRVIQIMFAVGVVLILIAVLIFIRRFIKNGAVKTGAAEIQYQAMNQNLNQNMNQNMNMEWNTDWNTDENTKEDQDN